jgi:hypothetical protein
MGDFHVEDALAQETVFAHDGNAALRGGAFDSQNQHTPSVGVQYIRDATMTQAARELFRRNLTSGLSTDSIPQLPAARSRRATHALLTRSRSLSRATQEVS